MEFEYSIEVQPLIPKIGSYRYVAKFAYFYKVENGKDIKVSPPVAEVYGETEKIAEEKLIDRLNEWKKQHE